MSIFNDYEMNQRFYQLNYSYSWNQEGTNLCKFLLSIIFIYPNFMVKFTLAEIEKVFCVYFSLNEQK